jgi:hypothetical protein
MDMTKLLERVRKLLAIANDTRANPNEAAAAAAQAENIMRKFNIEHADVLLKRVQSGEEEFETANVSAFMKRDVDNGHVAKRNPKWAGWLAVRVARVNDCDVRYTWDAKRGAAVQFCGYKNDVQVAAWMFDYLLGCMINDVRAWQKTAPRGKIESNAYRDGFITAVCSKLANLHREREAEMQQKSNTTALVVAKAAAIAEHFGNFNYGKASTTQVRDQRAFMAGVEAGRKVDVARRGLTTSASAMLAIAG